MKTNPIVIALVLLALLGGVARDVFANTLTATSLLDLKALRDRAFTQNTEYHGFVLDDQFKLMVEHINDTAFIQLHKRQRPPGGPFQLFDEDTGEDEGIIRFEQVFNLVRIRSEAIVPAPPNYLQNPGQRYRITINGIHVAPEFHRVFEVNAGDALAATWNELMIIYNMTYGVNRPAIYFGGLIAMQVLNKSGHLPAEIPLGTIRSKAAQVRISDEYLIRRGQARVERFPRAADGSREFARVFQEDSDAILTQPAPPGFGAGRTPSAVQPERPGRLRPYQHERYRDARDARRDQLREIGDQKMEPPQQRLGRAGRPLTQPEHDFPAVSAAQMDSLELLLGETRSAMQTRMESPRTAGPPPRGQRPQRGR